MKALTITQPWATLVAIGAKRIETRSWRTSYRGPLAIHAAKGFPKAARQFTLEPVCYEEMRRSAHIELRDKGWPAYPLGYVMATCRLVACIETDVLSEVDSVLAEDGRYVSARERVFGNFSAGRYAWYLTDIKPLPEPMPAKGALSLWEWNP
jgi:activating signal cointegrator 1